MVELEEWYFGNIDNVLAGNKCKKDGDFLVRYSVSKQRYIITCKWKGICHHYIVGVSIYQPLKLYIKHWCILYAITDLLMYRQTA